MKQRLPIVVLILALAGLIYFSVAEKRSAPAPRMTDVPTVTEAPESVHVRLSPETLTVEPETEFSLFVMATSEQSVNGADIVVSFDPTVMTFTAIRPGTYFASTEEIERTVDAAAGMIRYSFDGEATASGTRSLAEISFTSTSDGKSGIVKLENGTVVATLEDEYGTVRIGEATSVTVRSK